MPMSSVIMHCHVPSCLGGHHCHVPSCLVDATATYPHAWWTPLPHTLEPGGRHCHTPSCLVDDTATYPVPGGCHRHIPSCLVDAIATYPRPGGRHSHVPSCLVDATASSSPASPRSVLDRTTVVTPRSWNQRITGDTSARLFIVRPVSSLAAGETSYRALMIPLQCMSPYARDKCDQLVGCV